MVAGDRMIRAMMVWLALVVLGAPVAATAGVPAATVTPAQAADGCMAAPPLHPVPARHAPAPCAADCPVVCSPILIEPARVPVRMRQAAQVRFGVLPSFARSVGSVPDPPPPRTVSA